MKSKSLIVIATWYPPGNDEYHYELLRTGEFKKWGIDELSETRKPAEFAPEDIVLDVDLSLLAQKPKGEPDALTQPSGMTLAAFTFFSEGTRIRSVVVTVKEEVYEQDGDRDRTYLRTLNEGESTQYLEVVKRFRAGFFGL